MTTRYASDVAQRLVDELLISEDDQQRAFEIIEEFWKDYAMDVWDYQNLASEFLHRGLPLSKSASREILAEMEKNLDSDQGFNWDTLHNATNKWLKNVSWSKMTDEELASFDEETCSWAVITADKVDERVYPDTATEYLHHSNTEVYMLPPALSLLEAVKFGRIKANSNLPEPAKSRIVTVYALATDLAEEIHLEEIPQYGHLVWDSQDCEYCGTKHDTPNFAYHICVPKESKTCDFCGKNVSEDEAHFPHEEGCSGVDCDCDLIAHPDCCDCDGSDNRICK